jgi:L-fuconolactonase
MRIDAHQHFWIYDAREYEWIDESIASLRRNFLPDDLQPELRRHDFHGCVAVQARQSLDETHWLLELAERATFILGVVGWVDLREPDLRAQLKTLTKNPKLVGIRHIVQSEADDRFLLQPDFLRGISLLEEFNLAYDILIYPKHLSVAAEFVGRFPRQRFVLDHLAKPFIKHAIVQPWEAEIRELAKFPNVYCKLSGLVTEADWQAWTPDQLAPYLDVAFDCFGPGRVMFGSDWPVCTVAGSYSRVFQGIENYARRFPVEVQEAVLGRNAAAFYGLSVGAQQ